MALNRLKFFFWFSYCQIENLKQTLKEVSEEKDRLKAENDKLLAENERKLQVG